MIKPDYTALHGWEVYARDLGVEYTQCLEEGKDVEPYADLFQAIQKMPTTENKIRMGDILFDLVSSLPTRKDYPYQEPSDLEGIRALSEQSSVAPIARPSDEIMLDKLLGAWTGRIAGCLLGKIVEGIRTNELHPFLQDSGNFPMYRYICSADITPEVQQKYKFDFASRHKCYADKTEYMPFDDDTNYTVLAQNLIEKYGRDFTPDNVAEIWTSSQPRTAYCTAERVAFRNFMQGFRPPMSAQWQNPYREWIGAQIRADYFGYINPGDPVTAADMAWRDACISHVKNGIYGEMFVAAMLAQAAVDSDIPSIIRAGLGQIPATSRLHESVSELLKMWENGASQEECLAKITAQYSEYTSHGWCHTISNAMLVTFALLYGGGDYGKSICLAVQQGYDTDCNGATVGSILGMRGGDGCIDEEWKAPLHDKLQTTIVGMSIVHIADVAKKTLCHITAAKA